MDNFKKNHKESEQSDEQLCLLARQGDPNAEELLAVRYFSVVKSCARPYFLAGGEAEDLIQEGMLGLLKAVRAFEPARGVPFAPYARMCITRRIYSAVRAASADKHEPLNRSAELMDSVTENSVSFPAESDPAFLLIGMEEKRENLRRLTEQLSPLEAKIFTLYLSGSSYEQMARAVGRPIKSVDNAVQRIRRKASAIFLDENR